MRKLSTATPSSVFFLPPSPHSESHLARETSVTRTADNNYPRFQAKRGRSLASLLVMSSYLLSRRYWYKWGYFGLFLSCMAWKWGRLHYLFDLQINRHLMKERNQCTNWQDVMKRSSPTFMRSPSFDLLCPWFRDPTYESMGMGSWRVLTSFPHTSDLLWVLDRARLTHVSGIDVANRNTENTFTFDRKGEADDFAASLRKNSDPPIWSTARFLGRRGGRRLVYIRILYNIQNLRKQIYLQQN